jgi:uncharacterized protein
MRPKRSLLHLLKVVSLTLVLTACSQAATDEQLLAVLLPTSPASNAPSPAPSATPTSTLTATLAPTPTPTYHPMAIPALRQLDYPGSDIVIERELESGVNYDRFYASYLSEGLKIYGLLTVPHGEMPPTGWPAIVFNHGYIPPDVYKTTERYIAYVDRLAQSGYVVFRIDYRGHDQSEGEATGAYGDPGYTIDVLNAVSSLKQYPLVDSNRIGMWGHSMGGYLTLRSMVVSPDIKVGVIWAGVVGSYEDLLYNWQRRDGFTPTPRPDGRSWRVDWVETYGSPAQNPTFWDSVSSNSYLEDISGPVQLHHGTSDESVPVAFSEELFRQLLEDGKMVELYTYPEDNHNISMYFSTAMNRTIEFFDRYLK